MTAPKDPRTSDGQVEPTYDHAFEAVPRVWREVLE